MPTLHRVGLSGGKDSTALWGWILNESGIDPALIRGSFADTGNEYAETYAQIRACNEYGISKGAPPVKTLRTIGFLNLCKKKKRFPSARARFCTEILKMEPSRKYMDKLKKEALSEIDWRLKANKDQREFLEKNSVIGYTGVRGSESAERAKLADEDYSTYYKIIIKRPLLDWTIAEVWEAHKTYGLPINPLYLQGRKRVGCRLCCMSNKRDVRVTASTRPDVIAQYRRWEKIVGKNRSYSGFSSFFAATTVPIQFRSLEYVNKEGELFKVCTIDDVVRWSYTLWGGKDYPLPFIYEMDEDDDYDKGLSCKSAMGSCE